MPRYHDSLNVAQTARTALQRVASFLLGRDASAQGCNTAIDIALWEDKFIAPREF